MENKIYYIECYGTPLLGSTTGALWETKEELLQAIEYTKNHPPLKTICYFIIKPKNTQHNEPKI